MTKKQIDAFDYAKEITQATKKGILVNTMADGRFNTMTVSWGSLGTEWNRPIFTVYIRNSRFTHAQLEKNPEFTISIPMGEYDKKIIGKAGVQTGWKTDKQQEYGLELVEPEQISVPGIRQFPLTLECRVIYKQQQPLAEIGLDEAFMNREYPQDQTDQYKPLNNCPHTEFIGEIVAAYIIED